MSTSCMQTTMAFLGMFHPSVAQCFDILKRVIKRIGLPLHEFVDPTTSGELMGVDVDGVRGRVRPSMKRIWTARQAFAYLASGPRVTGEDIMILIGHATYMFFLFKRSLMCIFRAT